MVHSNDIEVVELEKAEMDARVAWGVGVSLWFAIASYVLGRILTGDTGDYPISSTIYSLSFAASIWTGGELALRESVKINNSIKELLAANDTRDLSN